MAQEERPLLDTLVGDRTLEMLKAVIPYMLEPQQKQFSVFVKMMELQKTLSLFETNQAQITQLSACSCMTQEERTRKMLQALRPFCTQKEQETLDTLLQFSELAANYETLF